MLQFRRSSPEALFRADDAQESRKPPTDFLKFDISPTTKGSGLEHVHRSEFRPTV